MKKIFAHYKQEDGAVAIIMAFAMVVLLGFAAFAVDIGLVDVQKSHFQNACDAAALAAVRNMSTTALATATAKEYIVKNGFAQGDITVTFPDSNSVLITGIKQMPSIFGNIFRVSHLDYTCSAKASSVRKALGGVFDYAIYSGNVYPAQSGRTSFSVKVQNICTLSGLSNWVYGNVHANYNIDANTSNIAWIGEAVGTVTGVNIIIKHPGIDYIPMPDFTIYKAQIKAEAIAAGQYYPGNFSSANKTSLDLSAPLYVEGEANLSGMSLSGKGCIYAGGKIKVTGTATNYDSLSKICMYSGYTSGSKSDEAISFGGSDKTFTGMLYAPNGSISVTGAHYTFNGCVIGRVVDVSGSDKTFKAADITESFPYATTSSYGLIG